MTALRFYFMSKRALRNENEYLQRESRRYEGVISHLTGYTLEVENDRDVLSAHRNELFDRQTIVVEMIEGELSELRTIAPAHRPVDAIVFLEDVLMALRPARLTPAAWADQTIT